MIPAFILSNWRLIAVTVLLGTNLFTYGMWRHAEDDLKLVELRSEIAAQEAAATLKEQKQITEDTTNAWKAALDSTRDDWAKRLRLAKVQPMPGISGPTGGVDALPADSLALAAQCAETTLNLRDLQDWVKRQRKL